MLLVLRVSLWNYRMGLPGFQLPDRIRSMQREFDESVSKAIECMCDHLEGKPAAVPDIHDSLLCLEESVSACAATASVTKPTDDLRTFLARYRRVSEVTCELLRDISS